MKKVNLDEIRIEDNFMELSENCLMAVDGGCGGTGCGSITEGIRFPTKWGWVYW